MRYPWPHYRLLEDDPHYSYALESDYKFELDQADVWTKNGKTEYLAFSRGRVLTRNGYHWDGPSGPVVHTTSWVRASLVHDILYQMMRLGWLSYAYRKHADDIMYELTRADGMPWWRAWYSWIVVRLFGGKYARPELPHDDP